MPPRSKASPAPSARAAATSPATKTPVAKPASAKKAPASSRPSKSPARGKKAAEVATTSSPPAEEPPAVPTSTPTAVAATSKKTTPPKASPPAPPDYTCAILAVAFGVILALLGVASQWPLGASGRSAVLLSAKSFKGNQLAASNSYNGSALIVFTSNATDKHDPTDKPARDLSRVMKSADFKTQLSTWWDSDVVRIGKVYCNQQVDLCKRFGISGGADEEPGLPYITWFKSGEEMEAFDGERTLEGFRAWVDKKQADGVL